MKIEDLQAKVNAAELKVEKCQKTIERHTSQLEKKAKQLRQLGIDPETTDKYAFAQNGGDREVYWLLCDYSYKKNDIASATEKLADAKRICENWKEKLDLQINREKVIQNQVPDVIKDFLQKWKEDAFGWYVQRHAAFLDFKKDLRGKERAAKIEALQTLPEYAKLRERAGDRLFDDFYLNNPWPRQPMENFLKARDLDYNSIIKRLSNFADSIVSKMCDIRDEAERLTWLDSTLEEEKKYKMLDLVERVNKVTGPITDVKGLYLSNGDLNGIVLGEKGAAKVQTISAGGYNIQCFHYRVLIDDVTKKYVNQPSEKKQGLDAQIKAASDRTASAGSSHSISPKSTER